MIGGYAIENKINIKQMINKVLSKFDDVYLFYHRLSGEILSIDKYYLNSLKSSRVIKVLYSWQEDIIDICTKILDDNYDNYLLIPDKSNINNYMAMDEFIKNTLDENEREDIKSIIIGDDRYGRFRSVINGTYLEDLWNIFIYDEIKKLLIKWCDENELHYED